MSQDTAATVVSNAETDRWHELVVCSWDRGMIKDFHKMKEVAVDESDLMRKGTHVVTSIRFI